MSETEHNPPARPVTTILVSVLVLSCLSVSAQPIPDYHIRSGLLLASPGSFDQGLVGFTNPANLAFLAEFESRIILRTNHRRAAPLDDGGLFLGLHGIGLSYSRRALNPGRIDDFKLSLARGSPQVALGLGYGWSRHGANNTEHSDKILSAGLVLRPNKSLSFGLVGNFSIEGGAREAVLDLGVRPFGSGALTLFGDASIHNEATLDEINWSAGLILSLASGLDLIGRYFDTDAVSLGLSANFGRTGLRVQSRFDAAQSFSDNTYVLRHGSLVSRVMQRTHDRRERYVVINLHGRVDYHRYRYLDSSTRPLYPILRNIQAAASDPRIQLIVINLSGMRILPEHAWEIREALASAQQAGKRVLAFIDMATMTSYHLASVADWVVLDPQGSISLPGYAISKTYLKGTLAKLGLGFDAWRFFEYKSAVEVLSRDRMSTADSLQNKAYLADRYQMVRSEICSARGMTAAAFDQIVNEEVFVLASRAVSLKLIDEVGRFSGADELIVALSGKKLRRLPAEQLYDNAMSAADWGSRKKIALVYGLGVCAMDTGIRARWLERVFLRLAADDDIKAVVFRVDSPGGDGMASDIVAEALRKCAEQKPVIVSQGQVAGSGGYWIGLHASRIVAAPITVTGSIGVIGGWLYDDGFSGRIGMTSDLVQEGAHADLWRGIQLPIFGTIPARNLTVIERSRMESLIRTFYDDFVNKVAAGRRLPVATVRRIAEGRIYSGLDGKAVGLVDEIGGLLQAIAIARQEASIAESERVDLVEIPQDKGLINLGLPSLPVSTASPLDPVLAFIKMLATNPGLPLFMLQPGQYPDFE